MTVREILRQYPSARAVFDRYGMGGCGGADGPEEPVRFFAEMHGLRTADLIEELRQAIHESTKVPAHAACSGNGSCGTHAQEDPCPCGPEVPERGTISPRAAKLLSAPEPRFEKGSCTHGGPEKHLAKTFIRAAMTIFLLYGGITGLVGFLALTTTWISVSAPLTWPALIQSHAHAQIFGFAAMFVLGISYHVMPRFMGVSLQNLDAAWASYALLLGGVIIRGISLPLAERGWAGSDVSAMLAVAGSFMELMAVGAFLLVVRSTLAEHKKILPAGRSGQPFVHIQYLMVGSLSFLVAAIVSLSGAFGAFTRHVGVQSADINAVWINVSLIGFIGMFIFGVGQRTMPHFLALDDVRPAFGRAALAVLTAGIILQPISLLLPESAADISKNILAGSAILELFGFTLFLIAVPLLGRYPVHRPAAPHLFPSFIRSAFAWGWIGCAGYAAAAVMEARGVPMSRTVTDAYRHAWTLGWITMLIAGVGYRVVPIFFGKEIRYPRLIGWVYFGLMSAAVIRVAADLAALKFEQAYAWTNISGVLAIAAVALFAIEIFHQTGRSTRAEQKIPADALIDENSNVAAVLDAHPELLLVFIRHGFLGLQNPVARKTVARFVTIGQAAQKHGVSTATLVRELNNARRSS